MLGLLLMAPQVTMGALDPWSPSLIMFHPRYLRTHTHTHTQAYDSVSYPMLQALFRYIHLPVPCIGVPGQMLQGLMLFLVGGDVVREEVLRSASGIRHVDPLSLILFSLLTSLMVYVFCPLDAAV